MDGETKDFHPSQSYPGFYYLNKASHSLLVVFHLSHDLPVHYPETAPWVLEQTLAWM